jgi:exonuclease VII large subunit
MNPLSVLKRGYAAVSLGKKTVSRASEISEGDKIKLRFTDGVIDCVAGKRDDL